MFFQPQPQPQPQAAHQQQQSVAAPSYAATAAPVGGAAPQPQQLAGAWAQQQPVQVQQGAAPAYPQQFFAPQTQQQQQGAFQPPGYQQQQQTAPPPPGGRGGGGQWVSLHTRRGQKTSSAGPQPGTPQQQHQRRNGSNNGGSGQVSPLAQQLNPVGLMQAPAAAAPFAFNPPTVAVQQQQQQSADTAAPKPTPPQHGTVVKPFVLSNAAAGPNAASSGPALAAPLSPPLDNGSSNGGAPQGAPMPMLPTSVAAGTTTGAADGAPAATATMSVTVGARPAASQGPHLQYDPPVAAASPNATSATTTAVAAASKNAVLHHHDPLAPAPSDAIVGGSSFGGSYGGPPLPTLATEPKVSTPTSALAQLSHDDDGSGSASTSAATTPKPKPVVQLGKLHQGAAVLLRAEGIDEVRLMATHHSFTCPKAMRKQLTKQYRELDQIVVIVAIGDALAARAVMASEVIPRGNARRTIPDIEAAMPKSWSNVFRVTCAAVFDAAALELHLPCPVSDRSELPSQVPVGFVVPRVWNATLHGIIDATIALASGKSHHYDGLIAAVKEADPDAAEIPAAVADLVSPVRMVSHGPGVVALGFVARYFGREGRQHIANALFGLQSGVIDLCRQTMGGCLIAYLVRYGTCATPRILQLVPWRIVASRVLSDAVGSQTASLMLHSALHYHRTTRRSLDPVALTSLTHRVLTKNLADATDPTSDWTLSAVASNAQSCRVLQLVVEACVELLAMHASGEVESTPEIADSAQKVVVALCDLAAKHAVDPWSNYATQSLITACTLQRETTSEAVRRGQYLDSLLARVMVSIRPTIEHLACHKSGSNVVEKLCKARPGVTVEVASALVEIPGALGRLVADRFGNYVVQTLLQHLPPVAAVEERLRAALVPLHRTLDPHWHCAMAIDTWLRKVAARLGPMPGAHQLQQQQQALAAGSQPQQHQQSSTNNSHGAAMSMPVPLQQHQPVSSVSGGFSPIVSIAPQHQQHQQH